MSYTLRCSVVLGLLASQGCAAPPSSSSSEATASAASELTPQVAITPLSISFAFAHPNLCDQLPGAPPGVGCLPAGIAGDDEVVLVGDPLVGQVLALQRLTGQQVGVLPQPNATGFILPFILHSIGPGAVAILDAGGFPNPPPPPGCTTCAPFEPAIPKIYEYHYALMGQSFQATLTRTVDFADSPNISTYGFAEDMLRLDDGEYLVSDAVFGSIWRVDVHGNVLPGIVPPTVSISNFNTYPPTGSIPQLVCCNFPEPLVDVGKVPFLFGGPSIPGIQAMAVRNGSVYYHSPSAFPIAGSGNGALFKFPLAILTDDRTPQQRAADIQLVAHAPAGIQVEELLELTFDPFDPFDEYLYAADALQRRLIRIEPNTGVREVVANDPALFNFPSSLAFAPPPAGAHAPLLVVSNQQQNTPLTNLAISSDQTQRPYTVTEVLLTNP